VESVWSGTWTGPLAAAEAAVFRRRSRWLLATGQYEDEALKTPLDQDTEARDRYAARRNRIALAEPRRSTWMGDQFAAVEARVQAEYGLDLPFVWPRLWIVLPDDVRAELRAARDAFDSGTALAGWGCCYVLLTPIWWPACLIGAVITAAGWRRGRLASAQIAMLTESVVDLFGYALAVQLGFASDAGPLTRQLGQRITTAARKGA
jgi:hypothetical protein